MLRIFSSGGGIQSTACLILAAAKEINFPTFVFANTGDDSESKATLDYMKNVSIPFAEKHAIDLLVVRRKQTLYENLISDNREIPIPVYMSGNGAPGNRKCTVSWKIKPVARFARQRGGGVVGIGISIDECHRAKDSREADIVHEFPLLDLKLSRQECGRIIREAGLPLPPKSACWFCPYKRLTDWRTMASEDPEQFAKACDLEKLLIEKREKLGKDPVYLTRLLKPLSEAVLPDQQLHLFDDDCTGYCWT